MEKEYERYIELSWKILEFKCAYYRPDLVHGDSLPKYTVPDVVYDKLESEYKELCGKLGESPTASDMVGFDLDRPSCRLVVKKLGKAL